MAFSDKKWNLLQGLVQDASEYLFLENYRVLIDFEYLQIYNFDAFLEIFKNLDFENKKKLQL